MLNTGLGKCKLHLSVAALGLLALLGTGCAAYSKTATTPAAKNGEEKTPQLLDASKMLPEDAPLQVRWALDLQDRSVKDYWFPAQDESFDVPYRYVVALTDQNDAIAVDLRSGQSEWWTRLGSNLTGRPFATEYAIYLIVDSKVVCLDRDTGQVRWQVALPFPPATGPIVRELDKDKPIFYIGGLDRKLYALELISETWPPRTADPGHLTRKDFTLERRFFHVNWSHHLNGQVTVGGDLGREMLHVSDWAGFVYGIDFKLTANGRPENVWNFAARGPFNAAPRVLGPTLLLPSTDTNLYCLARRDGGLLWRFPTGQVLTRPVEFVTDTHMNRTYIMLKLGEKGPMVALNPRGPEQTAAGAQLPLWQAEGAEKIVARMDDPENELTRRCVVVMLNADNSLSGIGISMPDTRTAEQKAEQDERGVAAPAPELWRLAKHDFSVFADNTAQEFVFATTRKGRVLCALEKNF